MAGKLEKRTDRPFNLDWKNSKVKALGIWIGNEDTSNENFIEQQSKIKNKLIFWKRIGLSPGGGGTHDIFGLGCATIKSLYRPFLEFLTKKLDPFRNFCA